MMGLSTSGSISLGWALVAGRKRVPRPAAGKTALRSFMGMGWSVVVSRWPCDFGCRTIVNGEVWDWRPVGHGVEFWRLANSPGRISLDLTQIAPRSPHFYK